MIEINLLPEELRVKAKSAVVSKPAAEAVVVSKAKTVMRFAPVVAFVLVCLQIFLAGRTMVMSAKLRALNNKWQQCLPQQKILEKFNREYAILNQDTSAIKQLLKDRLVWAGKLNRVSSGLLPGMWLTELTLGPGNFSLRGSVVSAQKKEMTLINGFLDSLKKDPEFFGDFSNLELGSVQHRTAGTYDIADFVLGGALKSK